MDTENNTQTALVVLLIITIIWIFVNYSNMSSLEERILNYQDALSDANDNIEDANNQIRDAQFNAWEDYETMGESLENLYEVETIDEP